MDWTAAADEHALNQLIEEPSHGAIFLRWTRRGQVVNAATSLCVEKLAWVRFPLQTGHIHKHKATLCVGEVERQGLLWHLRGEVWKWMTSSRMLHDAY